MINFGAVAVACDVLGDGDGGGDDHNEWRARLWELGQRRGNVCRSGACLNMYPGISQSYIYIYIYKWIAPVVIPDRTGIIIFWNGRRHITLSFVNMCVGEHSQKCAAWDLQQGLLSTMQRGPCCFLRAELPGLIGQHGESLWVQRPAPMTHVDETWVTWVGSRVVRGSGPAVKAYKDYLMISHYENRPRLSRLENQPSTAGAFHFP